MVCFALTFQTWGNYVALKQTRAAAGRKGKGFSVRRDYFSSTTMTFQILLLTVLLAAIPHESAGQPSRITAPNHVPTLEVDGFPFLVTGAQCDIWRSTRQDGKTIAFFDSYAAMNATTVSIGIPWSRIETSKDHYHFEFMDWFIEQARQRNLKLVLNLFNSNVCGKVREGAAAAGFSYTPAYILEAADQYQRMVLPGPWQYDPGGPPMCPNDPRTLDRERRFCVKVAEHLARTDIQRTVIMLQIDNEFYYQQWSGQRPENENVVRCHCRFCDEKWNAGVWKDGEEFMFHSFAGYVRVLTDAISEVHSLPLYINSPWWTPRAIPIFLDQCPKLALVGIDGVFAPNEPNMLSRSQLGRNIPFAAENPTENPKTRLNLDVLPYYTLIGQQGLGNLLWECGPPYTVIDDARARALYSDALYPIRWAQVPIARARGTENLVGWHLIRDIASDVTTDVFGNFIPARNEGRVVEKNRLFVREGKVSRIVEADCFTTTLGDVEIRVSDSPAGIIVRTASDELLLALPKGKVELNGPHSVTATEGRFDRDRWISEATMPVRSEGRTTILDIPRPKVVLLTHKRRTAERTSPPASVGSMLAPVAPQPGYGTYLLSEIKIRDPFILPVAESQFYYLYRSMVVRLNDGQTRQGVGVYTSKDLRQWDGPKPVFYCPEGCWADQSIWAPEVHRFQGKYYLFATFTSKTMLPGQSGQVPQPKRGTQILVADSPEGPFQSFANRPHTPENWSALDGTLWVEDGVPYMIFCHEWTQIGDGTMDMVRLKKDLSGVVGPSKMLFKASNSKWVHGLNDGGGFVTDAPFIHRTKSGRLLMIWSSFDASKKYAVGIAYSISGKVMGPWKQLDEPLIANNGGHGMIFKTFDGRLMMVIHQPNDGQSCAQLHELEDAGDALRIRQETRTDQ